MPKDENIVHIIEHISNVQERLPWIELYHLSIVPLWIVSDPFEYDRKTRELEGRLRRSSRGSTCRFVVSWGGFFFSEAPFLNKFVHFLKRYRLPIELGRFQRRFRDPCSL
jgi:hypothetical protein